MKRKNKKERQTYGDYRVGDVTDKGVIISIEKGSKSPRGVDVMHMDRSFASLYEASSYYATGVRNFSRLRRQVQIVMSRHPKAPSVRIALRKLAKEFRIQETQFQENLKSIDAYLEREEKKMILEKLGKEFGV
jgi:hypothetical protein